MTWKPIETAPTNKPIRLQLKDGYGLYPFEPCKWSEQHKRWVNANSDAILAAKPVAWDHIEGKKGFYP